MVYPQDFESKIGFTTLRTMLEARCLSDMGRLHCQAMSMMTDYSRLVPVLRRVNEMKEIVDASSLPLQAIANPTESVTLLKVDGSHISAERFADLAAFLHTSEQLRRFFAEDAGNTRPELTRRFRNIPNLDEPYEAIKAVVNSFGQVHDNASPQLSDIRRRIAATMSSMQGLLRRVMDAAIRQGLIPADASPSMRDGHLVIPVSASNKKSIPGIVYDQSATGRTYYIEPTQVTEANNSLRSLQRDEQKEIIEILTHLSNEIRPRLADMEDAANQVGLIDFIRAKAMLARELDAELPTIARKPEIDWYHAVHPSLLLSLRRQGRQVVPLNLRFDADTRIIVISGPNAGGKSVTLKTIAMVQYMMQCGLLPTLYSNSHMGIFSKILIDIGDEQSIENDLSTYSSHLRNMRVFLSKATSDTLFLADEMGSGTEPQIGGAIAQAILGKLNADKAFGIITTHYQNLKTFANETPGLVNAAMLYDRQHLQPLFQLSIGTPGSSFALDIARKSGIPTDVIAEAKKIAGSDYVNIDKYLLDLARDKKYWADKRLSVKEKERKLDRMADELQARANEIKQRKAEIIHQARIDARAVLDTANARIENTIREIRATQAEKEKTRQVRRELDEYRREVENRRQSDIGKHDHLLEVPRRKGKKERQGASGHGKDCNLGKPNPSAAVSVSLAVGDYVRIPSSNIPGRILSISGKKAEIALGALRTTMSLEGLQRVNAPKKEDTVPTITASTTEDSRRRQLDFKREIDVRGMRADEALQAVTYFLDDAIQFQASPVRILHGTGTGALRQAIRGMLQANTAVTSFHDEDVRLGGAGITVVNLDN